MYPDLPIRVWLGPGSGPGPRQDSTNVYVNPDIHKEMWLGVQPLDPDQAHAADPDKIALRCMCTRTYRDNFLNCIYIIAFVVLMMQIRSA